MRVRADRAAGLVAGPVGVGDGVADGGEPDRPPSRRSGPGPLVLGICAGLGLLDLLLARLTEMGLVGAGGKQRTGSTAVVSTVRT